MSVTINTPGANETVDNNLLPQANGTAKNLRPSGVSRTLASMQVFVKPFIDDDTPPDPPSDLEWNGNPAAVPPVPPSGVIPSAQISFNGVLQQYSWYATGFPVRTAGNGKNKIWVRAKWVTDPAPPTYQYGIQLDPAAKEFACHDMVQLALRHAFHGHGLAEAQEGEAPNVNAQEALPQGVVAAPMAVIVPRDVFPACREGDWLLYKDLPASMIDPGLRLMLTPSRPLRAFELEIAAVDVNWELGGPGESWLGMRRPCGSLEMPTGAILPFPFPFHPCWSMVLHQPPGTALRFPNPFAIMSQSRCHPDVAVVDCTADVCIRLNYPNDLYALAQGTFSLWVRPLTGIPRCNVPPCATDPTCSKPCGDHAVPF